MHEELMNSITDGFVFVSGLVFFLLLLSLSKSLGLKENALRSSILWCGAFLFLSLGALLGGTYHLHIIRSMDLSIASDIALHVNCLFLNLAIAYAFLSEKTAHSLIILFVIVFGMSLILSMVFREFIYLIMHQIATTIVFSIILIREYLFRKNHDSTVKWLVASVLVSFLAAAAHRSHIRLSLIDGITLNHNDLLHVIIIGVYYCLYRGAKLLLLREAGRQRRASGTAPKEAERGASSHG